MKVKVISLQYILQVLYVLCFTRPRYQVSVYRTIGRLVLLMFHTSLFQYSNISKYAENFRKSNFMLIHGTGDGMSTVPKYYFNTPIQYTVNFTSVKMMTIFRRKNVLCYLLLQAVTRIWCNKNHSTTLETKWETTIITYKLNTKRAYGLQNEQLFSKRW